MTISIIAAKLELERMARTAPRSLPVARFPTPAPVAARSGSPLTSEQTRAQLNANVLARAGLSVNFASGLVTCARCTTPRVKVYGQTKRGSVCIRCLAGPFEYLEQWLKAADSARTASKPPVSPNRRAEIIAGRRARYGPSTERRIEKAVDKAR